MIYHVIPRELANRYFDEFKRRFEGVEGVEVIIDRREQERHVSGAARALRDSRRSRSREIPHS